MKKKSTNKKKISREGRKRKKFLIARYLPCHFFPLLVCLLFVVAIRLKFHENANNFFLSSRLVAGNCLLLISREDRSLLDIIKMKKSLSLKLNRVY